MPTTNSGSAASASRTSEQRVVERAVAAGRAATAPSAIESGIADHRREQDEEGRVLRAACPSSVETGCLRGERVAEVAGERGR